MAVIDVMSVWSICVRTHECLTTSCSCVFVNVFPCECFQLTLGGGKGIISSFYGMYLMK